MDWTFEDCVASLEGWAKEYWGDNVKIERIDGVLVKMKAKEG